MKHLFVVSKVFIQRAASYMTIITAGSLMFLLADVFQRHGINIKIGILAPTMFLASLLICLLLGWIDLKSGVYAEELKWGSENNPTLMLILKKVETLENLMEKK